MDQVVWVCTDQEDKEDIIIKKMISVLVVLYFLGFSSVYAHDPEDDDSYDQSVNIALVAAVVVTGFVLLATAHDWHDVPGGHHGPGGPREEERYHGYDGYGGPRHGGPGGPDGYQPYPQHFGYPDR